MEDSPGDVAEFGLWDVYRSQRDQLVDVERMFLILEGKEPRAPYAGIVGQIETERRATIRLTPGVCAGEYFKAR